MLPAASTSCLHAWRGTLAVSVPTDTVRSEPEHNLIARKAQETNHMAPTTKEGQRAELHKTIWRIANDLRGSVDGWDFKSYVLGMLFYRFISENLTSYINTGEHKAGDQTFNLSLIHI